MKKTVISILFASSSLMANNISFFVSGNKIDYKEFYNSQVLDSEKSQFGDMKGFKISSEINRDKLSLLLSFKYLKGNTIYDGSSWDNKKASFKESGVFIYQTKMDIGYNLISNINIIGGIGYRLYNRGKSNNINDYNEKYKWKFYEIGLSIDKRFNKIFAGIKGLYHKAINPILEAEFFGGVTYKLGKTDGYSLIIPVGYQFNKNWSFVAQYDYEYWKSNKSSIINLANRATFEPTSKTKNSYINVGFRYSF